MRGGMIVAARSSRRTFGDITVRLIFAMLAAGIALPSIAEAGDIEAGKKKMVKCIVCHGKDGVSKNPDAPNLSGQVERYLLKSLLAFKAGERSNEQMAVIVTELEEADMADLAAYYASIKVTVEKPN
jgi:cytochrome c553